MDRGRFEVDDKWRRGAPWTEELTRRNETRPRLDDGLSFGEGDERERSDRVQT